MYVRLFAVVQKYACSIERQAEARVAGHLEGAAGQREGNVVGILGVDIYKEAVAVGAGVTLLAADARPRLASVHAQVDGIGLDRVTLRVGGDVLFGELRARVQLGQRGADAWFALIALRAVHTDGVALGVGQGFPVQRPVPVTVVGRCGTYLRGVAFIAFRAVVDGDSGRVQEADGVAHLHAVLHDRRHGGDVVRGAQQRLQGLDVGIRLGLPGFQGGDARGLGGQFFGVLIDLLPKFGVIVLAACHCQRGEQEEDEGLVCFHGCLFFIAFARAGDVKKREQLKFPPFEQKVT